MMVIEETQIPDTALPIEPLKRQLRLGSGFGSDDLQDEILASFLRAALAAIEARTGKALLARNFGWSVTRWRDPQGEVFPLAPVQAVLQVALVDRHGAVELLEPGAFRLEQDGQRPVLRPQGSALPSIPEGGKVEVRFAGGFGPDFSDLPADLGHAVLLLAAHYYEYRAETALGQGCMPFGVSSLIARYRPVRLGFGA